MRHRVSVLVVHEAGVGDPASLCRALASGRRSVDQVVVVSPEPRPPDLDDLDLPLEWLEVATEARGGLSLARARNAAADRARGDVLVFLDADCVPAPSFVREVVEALARRECVVMGTTVHRRPRSAASALAAEVPRPILAPHQQQRLLEPEAFDATCFGISREAFLGVGGFEGAYRARGGEDVDFACKCRMVGLPLWQIGARCFVGASGAPSPPRPPLQDLMHNASLFQARWGRFPESDWLRELVVSGRVQLSRGRIERAGKRLGRAEAATR